MSFKICIRCEREREIEEFNWKDQPSGRRSNICKKCENAYKSEKIRTDEDFRRRNIENATKRKLEIKQWWWEEVLQNIQCETCGESDPAVLDFAHIDPSTKKANVSELITKGYPKKTILEEVAKCKVLCSNCHRRETAKEQGWYSYLGV